MTITKDSVIDFLHELWWKIQTPIEVVLVLCLVFCVCAALVVGLAYLFGPPQCGQATADIGYGHRWLLFGGCQIEVEEGLWIPLENYRYIEP